MGTGIIDNRTWPDAALSVLLTAVCAAMCASAAVYALNFSIAAGAAVCVCGAAAALLCILLPRCVKNLDAKHLALTVCLLAFGLRAVYVLTVESVPVSDFELLYGAARDLASGDASALEAEYFQLWGYQIPFVLYEALIVSLSGGAAALALLNALWGAMTAGLVFALARRFVSDGAAFAAALLYAVCPDAVMLTPALTNQCISLAFILLGVYLACSPSWRRQLPAGLALAFGDLMRPEGLLALAGLAVALLLTLIRRDGGVKKRAIGFAALLAAYFALKLAVSGAIALSGIAPGGIGNAVPEWKFVLGLDTATLGRYDPKMEYILSIADPEARRAAAAEAIRASLGSCENLFGFFWDKTERFWGAYEESWLGVTSEYIYPLRFFERIFFTAASLLALIGCLGRRESRAETAARGVVFANFFVYLFIEVQPRYRYFVWPFLLMLAAAGIKRLCALVRGGRKTAPAASGHRRGERV